MRMESSISAASLPCGFSRPAARLHSHARDGQPDSAARPAARSRRPGHRAHHHRLGAGVGDLHRRRRRPARGPAPAARPPAVDRGRARHHRRGADLRRAGRDVPARGRPVSVPEGSLRPAVGLPLRVGVVPGRDVGRHRGPGRRLWRVPRQLRPVLLHRQRPARGGRVADERRPGRGRARHRRPHRDQLRRAEGRRGRPEPGDRGQAGLAVRHRRPGAADAGARSTPTGRRRCRRPRPRPRSAWP